MIVACEPQCVGFEHAEVNAALVATAALAFPGERIVFLAEEGHIAIVRKRLEIEAVGGVEFRAIAVPPRGLSESRRVLKDFASCKRIARIVREYPTDRLLFTSTTSSDLFAIKHLLGDSRDMRIVVVVHGILDSILRPPKFSIKPWKRMLWFRNALMYRDHLPIRYLVPGPVIEEEWRCIMPQISGSVCSIHMPYFYGEPQAFEPYRDGTVNFGFFGTVCGVKGGDAVYRMAEDVAAVSTRYRPQFTVIGPVVDRHIREIQTEHVCVPSPDAPLSREEFDRHAWRMDYSVHFHKQDAYRLRASATLFDSFYYVKPVIALRNHCFEHYFDLMGDIGYICDSYDDVREVILDLLNNPSIERYMQQRDNILRGRIAFSPSGQASKIASLFA